ncbi:hypothetical protein N9L83_02805 [Flavobacteriales bacterium]|nr:hypothetical protein [Flavobacteriales bacterium]
MKQTKVLALMAFVMLSVSCGGPQESAAMKEAKAVHEQLTRIGEELHESLMVAMAPLEDNIDSAMMVGDTLLAAQLAKMEGKLDRIDVRFHDWSDTVVEIPGQACTHDHDHSGHDHGHSHDHDGHDHAHDHVHDHGATLPEGLSDEEILEIQQALKAELDKLKAEFDRIRE